MRLSFSALFFLPLVFAVSNLSVSQNLTSGGPVTITWTADSTDPATCSFELANEAFHNTFAILNNIPINTGSITANLPAVPYPAQYTLEAVRIDNVTSVLGTSAPFTIGAPTSTTTSSASTSSPASSSSVSAASTTGSSASAQTSSSSGSRASSSTPSSSATSSSFNGNGALSHIDSSNVGSIAAIVIGIAAGAVFV